jgi:TRAP transporter TAXI family solute receptor
MEIFRVLMLSAVIGTAGIGAATAQNAAAPTPEAVIKERKNRAALSPEEIIKERKNRATVGIATGQLDAAYPSLAQDIAKVLDDGDNLRVLPIITYGSVGNIEDLLYLRNVDIAFTKADNFIHFKETLKINLQDRVHYITRLFDAELHVLVRPEIRTWEDLRGKKVNIGVAGNAAHTTVPIVMKALDLDFEILTLDHAIGLEMMKKGEISAAMRVGGKPMNTFSKIPPNSGFHFLPVSAYEFAQKFSRTYVLGKLTNEDYPTLIPPGEEITTIAVPDILAVYNWPKGTDRYQRVEKFITAFFRNFNKLREGPFHPKWKDINLAATIPGWTRSEIAERMLQEGASASSGNLREEFNAFLETNTRATGALSSNPAEREALFRQFLDWRNSAARR